MKIILLIFGLSLITVNTISNYYSYSFNTKDDDDFLYLPNEFPKLSPIFNQLKEEKPETYQKIKSLEPIIGYLPFIEQNILFGTISQDLNYLFNFSDYKQQMEEKGSDGKSILEKEKDAFMKYINNSGKRLPARLGCLMKVVQTFSKDSYEDNELVYIRILIQLLIIKLLLLNVNLISLIFFLILDIIKD